MGSEMCIRDRVLDSRARVRFLSILNVGFGFYPVGFQIYVRKRHILEKIKKFFLAFENFSTFFSNLKKNSLKNGL